jgi:flagellar hook-length control protein FliK
MQIASINLERLFSTVARGSGPEFTGAGDFSRSLQKQETVRSGNEDAKAESSSPYNDSHSADSRHDSEAPSVKTNSAVSDRPDRRDQREPAIARTTVRDSEGDSPSSTVEDEPVISEETTSETKSDDVDFAEKAVDATLTAAEPLVAVAPELSAVAAIPPTPEVSVVGSEVLSAGESAQDESVSFAKGFFSLPEIPPSAAKAVSSETIPPASTLALTGAVAVAVAGEAVSPEGTESIDGLAPIADSIEVRSKTDLPAGRSFSASSIQIRDSHLPAVENPVLPNATEPAVVTVSPRIDGFESVAQVVASAVTGVAAAATQTATTQAATTQAATAQVATAQVATAQVATAQVATAQVATAQVATAQVATPQAATAQVATAQVATAQAATPQAATPQVAAPQVAATVGMTKKPVATAGESLGEASEQRFAQLFAGKESLSKGPSLREAATSGIRGEPAAVSLSSGSFGSEATSLVVEDDGMGALLDGVQAEVPAGVTATTVTSSSASPLAGLGLTASQAPIPGAIVAGSQVPTTGLPIAEEKVISQVVGKLTLTRGEGQSSITMNLNPEELGRVRLELTVEGDRVRAQFHAQSQQVQEILEKHLPKLREAFENQGLKLDEVEVSSDSSQQQGGKGFYQDQRRSAPRFASQGGVAASTVAQVEERSEYHSPLHQGGISLRV